MVVLLHTIQKCPYATDTTLAVIDVEFGPFCQFITAKRFRLLVFYCQLITSPFRLVLYSDLACESVLLVH